MKTNIGIETTDEERKQIAEFLGNKGMASRDEVRHIAMEAVRNAIRGRSEETEQEPDREAAAIAPIEPEAVRDRSLHKFVPSRGDEDYLYRPQDPELAAKCSAALDGLEFIEGYIWDALERNRK